jgi:hypothetical protein
MLGGDLFVIVQIVHVNLRIFFELPQAIQRVEIDSPGMIVVTGISIGNLYVPLADRIDGHGFLRRDGIRRPVRRISGDASGKRVFRKSARLLIPALRA